jgi:hypothetical protein
MSQYRLQDLQPIRLLQDAFGAEVLLEEDAGGHSVSYRLLAEFALGESRYAVLQSDALKKDEEYAVFRIVSGSAGEPELETIMDDDEWEDVAELYDEWAWSREAEK